MSEGSMVSLRMGNSNETLFVGTTALKNDGSSVHLPCLIIPYCVHGAQKLLHSQSPFCE